MTAPVIEPAPVEALDDDLPHVACYHLNRTWCGIEASGPVVSAPENISDVCPVCVLAIEVWIDSRSKVCPVCGCFSCME